MSKENRKVDINKHEIDIDTLFKQNVNDLSAIKELYRKLQEVEERFSQIKYIDSTLAYKLKKEYEKLKKIILDENIQAKLANDIETINEKLTNDIETINEKLTDDIETIYSQQVKISNNIKTVESDVNKRLRFRNFKPKFGYNVMWGQTTDTNGGHTTKTPIEIGNDIKLCESLHIDEITLALYMGYNSNTDSLYSSVNISDVKDAMNYYKDFNVKIKTVKIHFGSITENYLFNTITFEKFDRLYKEFLKYICQQFQNTTVENITVLNEFFSIDNNPDYTSNVVNWLITVKSYGYKTGITSAGVEKAYLVQPEIHQYSDLICVNCYPKVSFIGNKITNEMCVNTWLQHDLRLFFEQMKKKYPDKKFIISETGVTNKWNDLIGSLPPSDTSPTDNKATETYLNGIFGSLNDYPIDSVWWWFGIYTTNTKIQELFDYNLIGVINNE